MIKENNVRDKRWRLMSLPSRVRTKIEWCFYDYAKTVLIYDKPFWAATLHLSGHLLIPRGWPLNRGSAEIHHMLMSYQRDSRGDSFASRRANYKLYVTTIVRQNGGGHRREWPLACLGKINLRWFNTTFFFSGNIKISHLIIVDNPSEVGSIFASKSVKIRNRVRKQEPTTMMPRCTNSWFATTWKGGHVGGSIQ